MNPKWLVTGLITLSWLAGITIGAISQHLSAPGGGGLLVGASVVIPFGIANYVNRKLDK